MAKTIIDYLKRASVTTPENTALVCGKQYINYQKLDQLSEKIALGLESLGVTPGARIGIYMDKSVLAIASIYAILKTGSCYVPISMDSPGPRVSRILEKCAIRHVLVENQLDETEQQLFQNANVDSISITQLLETVKSEKHNLSTRPKTSETSPAAILHTSGSTGTPKGAVITHKNLSVFISWAVSAFDINADDRLLSHAPLQFDLSFFDLFAALAASATVVLATAADTANAARMVNLVNHTGITIWQSVPSALSLQVVSTSTQQQPQFMPDVRCVLFAGERMPRSTLLGIAKIFANARFYNIYGCTETNNTFMYTLPDEVTKAPNPLPIGKVLSHIQYRIVDESGVDVSPGTKGHLWVAGDTIMAGYISLDKAGTAIYSNDKCVNGFYQTQDIVSVEHNGELNFHGRLDNVIKSNGYRINLMEIEDHLWQSKKFAEVAVLCEPDELIGNRIIAILKPLPGMSCSILDLKLYCAKSLPKYAIPHRFYLSNENLPKGSTGKIDKRKVAEIWQLEIC